MPQILIPPGTAEQRSDEIQLAEDGMLHVFLVAGSVDVPASAKVDVHYKRKAGAWTNVFTLDANTRSAKIPGPCTVSFLRPVQATAVGLEQA